MKLTVLGCGDAFGNEGRFNTSFMIEGASRRILIDCGASTLIRLKQFKIQLSELDGIFITHFHGDHYGGLPFLLISAYFEYKERFPIHLFGPPGLKKQVYILQEAMYPGTTPFLDELNIHFHEYLEDGWVGANDLSVTARKVLHAPLSDPHGIKVKVEDKLVAFSGDTEWTDALIELAKDTDLFICECNNWHHESPGHLSFQTIQKHKSELKAKRIVLNHMGTKLIQENPKDPDLRLLNDEMTLEF